MATVVLLVGRRNDAVLTFLYAQLKGLADSKISYNEKWKGEAKKNAVDQTIIIVSALQDKVEDTLSCYHILSEEMNGTKPYIVITQDMVPPEKFEEIRRGYIKGGVPPDYYFTYAKDCIDLSKACKDYSCKHEVNKETQENMEKMFAGLKFFKKQTSKR